MLTVEPFKPFDQMTAEDYAAIGFRCGLEVHRQLGTSRKLFCRCPAGRYSPEYDAEILRHMRPTLSEFGEYDGTALMEKKTRKNIYYRVHRDTVCTYEFDDTPPFPIDDEALDTAIELALLLRLNMADELHIARKQYLDGSIPAGFQRTTLLGVDGWIPFKDRRIGIRQLSLEEDACREVSDIGHERIYLTDRLGMALIEVVTEPDMKTPEEVVQVGQIIRKLCRSTGRVRTGYGAARQDVNVSVTGGTRVEIKGVPQLWRMPRLVYNEARRQCALLSIRDELERRGVTAESLECSWDDVTGIVSKTHYIPIRAALADGHRVKCVVLKKFADLFNVSTQEHTTFAKEFSDRIRVIACLSRLPNMLHSDTGSESLYGKDWQRIGKKAGATSADAMLLVWGDEADTQCACEEIVIRAREATIGVPSDTRQALKDDTHGFERVLPGAERMYPDTDLPPIALTTERIDRIRNRLPEYIWHREERYRSWGLSPELIDALSTSPRADLLDRLVNDLGIDAVLAGVVLACTLKALRRSGLPVDLLADETVFATFDAFAKDRFAREGISMVLKYVAEAALTDEAPPPSVDAAIEALGLKPAEEAEIASVLTDLVAKLSSRRFCSHEARLRFAMGFVMHTLRGRVAGDRLLERVTDALTTQETKKEANA